MGLPALDGFMAMADIADDKIMATQLDKRVKQILGGKKEEQEKALADLYIDTEEKLLDIKSIKLNRVELRRHMNTSFSGIEKEFPGFSLLFISEPKQFISLSNKLIAEYAKEWHRFFGKEIVEKVVIR